MNISSSKRRFFPASGCERSLQRGQDLEDRRPEAELRRDAVASQALHHQTQRGHRFRRQVLRIGGCRRQVHFFSRNGLSYRFFTQTELLVPRNLENLSLSIQM